MNNTPKLAPGPEAACGRPARSSGPARGTRVSTGDRVSIVRSWDSKQMMGHTHAHEWPIVRSGLRFAGAGCLAALAVVNATIGWKYAGQSASMAVLYGGLAAVQICAATLLAVAAPRAKTAIVSAAATVASTLLAWELRYGSGLPVGPGPGQAAFLGQPGVAATLLEALAVVSILPLANRSGGPLDKYLGRRMVKLAATAVPVVLTVLALVGLHVWHSYPTHQGSGALGTSLASTTTSPGLSGREHRAHALAPHEPGGGTQALAGPVAPQDMPGMPAGGHDETTHAGTDTLGLGDAPAAASNLGVVDQVSDGKTMNVGVAELDGTPSWVVVQREVNGRPGPLIGLTRRLNGQAGDATTVRFTAAQTSGAYWVSLHRDLGRQHMYEFPGPDVVAVAAGSPLQRRVLLTVR